MASQDRKSEGWTNDVLTKRVLQLFAVAWLPVLSSPISQLLQANPTVPRLALTLAGVAIFVATYLWTVFGSAPYGSTVGVQKVPHPPPHSPWLRRWLPVGILTTLSVLLVLAQGAGWLGLFIFTSVATAFRLPVRPAARVLPALAILAIALGAAEHALAGDTGSIGFTGLSVGAGIASVIYALATVRELRAARGELARLAVAEERLRFARDLHDLLGHSLSLIALKSELAGQLALQAPERAAAEMRDVEGVARTALREVREAVAGYRQPTLVSELAAAVEILSAAGIAFSSEGDPGLLPARVEAALAWTVREGVTNVIRHSRARACAVHLARDADQVIVEVTDDGEGVSAEPERQPVANGAVRSGLAGLTERVTAVGGRVEAEPRTPRGFRLAAAVPVAREDWNAGTPARRASDSISTDTTGERS